jgi:hypothetical protein
MPCDGDGLDPDPTFFGMETTMISWRLVFPLLAVMALVHATALAQSTTPAAPASPSAKPGTSAAPGTAAPAATPENEDGEDGGSSEDD